MKKCYSEPAMCLATKSRLFQSLLLAWLVIDGGVSFGQIVLDGDFDHGGLDEGSSSVNGSLVSLVGRTNYYGNQWKWLYFSADNVNSVQPTFEIDDNFVTGSASLDDHEMVYSYDQENWLFFDNNNLSSGKLTFSNNTPFSQNQVFVAYGLPYSYGRATAHTAQMAASPWVTPTLSGNSSLVIGQTPGGIDDLGRVVAPRDVFGYKITDSGATGSKKKIGLMSGVHPNETLGNYTLEGLVNFLTSSDLEAALLRKYAEFYVYPLANPDGRFAGYNRSTVQNISMDPNRFWESPSYGGQDDIKVIGDALLADVGDVDYFIDFHSSVNGDKPYHYADLHPDYQADPFWLTFLQLEPETVTRNATLNSLTGQKFGRDELGAEFTMGFETSFLAGENIDRFADLGKNLGLAFEQVTVLHADLNFDSQLDEQDWLQFIAGAETDLSSLTPIQAYEAGDLDGDGVNSIQDFGDFKRAFDAENGPGAFVAMLAGVPEPNSCALLILGCLGLVSARGRRRAQVTSRKLKHLATHCGFVLLATMLTMQLSEAGILEEFLFNEDNGKKLEEAANNVNPGNDWTQSEMSKVEVFDGNLRVQKDDDKFGEGWLQIDNITSGTAWWVAEFTGWSFSSGSGSSDFDPEELEEIRFGFITEDTGTSGGSNAAQIEIQRTATGGLELVGTRGGSGGTNIAGSVGLNLVQTSPVTIVLEINKDVDEYSVFHRYGAGPFQQLGTGNIDPARDGNSIRFVANNNFSGSGEYVDIERFYLTDESPLNVPYDALTLRVNTDTGFVEIENDTTTSFDIDSYRIESSTDDLNFSAWNSLSDQSIDSMGGGIGQSWDEAGGSDDGVLAESFLLGSSMFGNGRLETLGYAFEPGGNTGSLSFTYRSIIHGTLSDELFEGTIELVTGLSADFDGDLDVDGVDFLKWQRGFGLTGQIDNSNGDADGSGTVDGLDLVEWEAQFGLVAALSAVSSVPEPTSAALALVALCIVMSKRPVVVTTTSL